MCLHVIESNANPKVAEEDIVVYKFAVSHDGNGLSAPYRKSKYPGFGELMEAKLNFIPAHYEYVKGHLCVGEVEDGLHSFATDTGAAFVSKRFRREYPYNSEFFNKNTLVLIKCRIPKGATYYSGMFSNVVSYASNQLIIDEIVDFSFTKEPQ